MLVNIIWFLKSINKKYSFFFKRLRLLIGNIIRRILTGKEHWLPLRTGLLPRNSIYCFAHSSMGVLIHPFMFCLEAVLCMHSYLGGLGKICLLRNCMGLFLTALSFPTQICLILRVVSVKEVLRLNSADWTFPHEGKSSGSQTWRQ